MDYDYERLKLKELIAEKALIVRKEPIPLSNGSVSHHYYDLKKVVLDPLGAKLISTLMLEEVLKFGKIKSVGGLEVGAIPIATAISIRSHYTNDNISTFYVRKQPKEHGLKKLVEGNASMPIVIVDDVVTKGASVKKAIDALTEEGHSISGIVSIIDRGGGKTLKENGLRFSSIFEDKDFEDEIRKKKEEQNINS
ncbi:MAG: orotate phosphoribosyltransferase [Thermoproteota archaeon]|nr:orotate phosphoribosyltransferase [Thermoproteota archaeon]